MFVYKFFKWIDLTTPAPKLLVDGNDRLQTFAGGIFTFIFVVLTVTITMFFSNDLVFRLNPLVVESSYYLEEMEVMLNKENFFFALGIGNIKGSINELTGYFKVEVKELDIFMKVNEDGTKKRSYGTKKLETEPCHKNSFGEVFQDNLNFTLDKFVCLKPDFSIKLRNPKGNANSDYTFFKVHISNCNPEVDQCHPAEERESLFSDHFVTYKFSNVLFNHESFSNPIESTVKNLIVRQNLREYTMTDILFKEVVYTTDEGILFENQVEKRVVSFEDSTNFSVIRNEEQKAVPLSFSETNFAFNDEGKGTQFRRSYEKCQNVLANIGGFLKGCLAIFEILSKVIATPKMQHSIYKRKMEPVTSANLNSIYLIRENRSQNSIRIQNGNFSQFNVNQRYFYYRMFCRFCMKNKKEVKYVKMLIDRQEKSVDVIQILQTMQHLEALKTLVLNEDSVELFEKLSEIIVLNQDEKREVRKVTLEDVKNSTNQQIETLRQRLKL